MSTASPSRAERLAEARTYAGCRQAHFARQTGTLILVVEAEAQGLDPDGTPFYTICDDHGQCVGHSTLADARWHASAPLGWCEVCNGTDTLEEEEDR